MIWFAMVAMALMQGRSTSLAGTVLTATGAPVAGARVFPAGDDPKSATTDAAGRFRLDDVGDRDGPALIFAEKAGFRFGGAVVATGKASVEIRLAVEGEKPVASLKTLPSPISRAEERALGRKLLEPVLVEGRRGKLGPLSKDVMPALARLDPDRVLTMLEERVIARPSLVLGQVALGQFEDDPLEAIATIELDRDPGSRAWGFLALAGSVPPSEAARRGELLDRAFAEARKVAKAEAKIPLLGEIADRRLSAGELAPASAALLEGKAIIEGTRERTEFYMFDKFAEVLAAIDLPAARAIIEGKGNSRPSPPDDPNVRRHEAEAAVRVAATDPAEAERMLEHGHAGENIGDHEDLVFRVAIRMARADLPRARKLLKTIADRPDSPDWDRPALVPYGLGLIAGELASVDPAGARRLLDEAFAGLLPFARDPGNQPKISAPILMAALLPVVERVDPDRLLERAWLAASCPLDGRMVVGDGVSDPMALAMLLSRYDRTAAVAIAASALERLPEMLGRERLQYDFVPIVISLVAAYDPRAIARLGDALPSHARLVAAEMLGRPIGERRRVANERAIYPFHLLRDRW